VPIARTTVMVDGRSAEGLIGALWGNRPSGVKRCQAQLREMWRRMHGAPFVVIMEPGARAPPTPQMEALHR
jgi:hypothetical protein